MDNQQQFHKAETRLDHDLRDGDKTHAAVSLLHEFENKPQEALSLIKREMQRQSQPANHDKLHLGIQSNGDVIVWDKGERSGYYAGNIPEDLRSQIMPPAAVPQETPAPAPAPQEAPAAPQEAPAPAPAQPTDMQAPPPPPAELPEEHRGAGPQPYEYEHPHRKGFHIPCPIDIGVRNGSFHLGVNVLGLVKGGVSLGEHTRGYVGSDVLKTDVSAGVDLNKEHIGPAGDWHVFGNGLTSGSARVGITPRPDGINLGAGADARLFGHAVGAGGHGGLEMGERLGPHADGYAFVGPAHARADGYANLSDRGLRAGTDAEVGAEPLFGVHEKTRVGLGTKNEAHADVGAHIGDNGASAGAGIYPQWHPDAYLRGYNEHERAGVGLNPPRAWHEYYDDLGWTPPEK